LGGGMYSHYRSPKLIDCTFENNYAAGGGGGMYIYDSSTILIDCKFTGNWTHYSYGAGGGIYINELYGSNLKLTDTIVCDNFPDQILGDWTDNGGNTVADECECIGDLDTDGDVDIDDLFILISEWGICSEGAPTGACCLNLNMCVEDLTEAQCVTYGGKYLGDMSMCMDDSCSSEAGDFCETARVIYPGANFFDTSTATDSGFGEPEGCYLDWRESPDRWMIYTATGNGTITVDTCDPNSYDTSLVIYEGSDCGELDQVACNGDSEIPQGCQSYVSSIEMLPVSAGMNYYVRVGGWRAATGTGTVNLIFDGTGTVGACCIGSDCSILSESDCVTSGGTYNGAGSDCGSVFCETPCEGDMNGDREVDVNDLLIFLTSWVDCE